MANVENQLQKTSLLELEKHGEGTGEKLVLLLLSLPKTHRQWSCLEKNRTVTLFLLFLLFTGKKIAK